MKSIEDFRIELIILIGSFQQFQQSDWPIFLVHFINSKKASIEQNITPGQERVRLETEIYNLNVAYGFGVYNFG